MGAQVHHKASRLLGHLRARGAGVPLRTLPWPRERIAQAAARGSHQSAKDDAEFVCEELAEFCAQGFWTVLPLSVAITLPHLRLSPLGVVPQRNRRPRLIVDYTFSEVNQDTIKLAPNEAMQFGLTLQRLLSRIVDANPCYGAVKLAKIDIADGFYRISLQPADIPKLGVILPARSAVTAEALVALPLALPMGWVESPPYFTSVTETACDLTNAALRAGTLLPRHDLEPLAATPPVEAAKGALGGTPRLAVSGLAKRWPPPLAYSDVYVDDFILAAQTRRHQHRTMRAALHSIDAVFRPLTPHDRPTRKAPVSLKKLRQGDAHWSTQKTVLGWDIDTIAGTITLPPHRIARLYQLLDAFPASRRRAPLAEWHQLLGELRSMALALPGARGMFSVLQNTLRYSDRNRVRLTSRVFDCLEDFRALANTLAARPTRLRELIPTSTASAVGACDACKRGMGGVWFRRHGAPIVWRAAFPPHIQAALITHDTPHGSISVSDLELAGIIAHKDILATTAVTAEHTIWLAGDNRASIVWARKGSATAVTARAYLLRLNALHQRRHRYVAQHDYIAGPVNAMADDASRRWDLTDNDLLTHFSRSYPQTTSWTLHHLSPAMHLALIGALSRRRCLPANLRIASPPPPPPGGCGNSSVPRWGSYPISATSPATKSLSCSFLPSATGPGSLPPAAGPSALVQWKTPCVMWRRRSPGWGPRTLA